MRKKIPNFIISFIGFFVFAILHNIVDALFHFEEAFFFLASLGMLFITPILLVVWVIKNIKRKK